MHVNFNITYSFNYYTYIDEYHLLLIIYKYNKLKWVKCIIIYIYCINNNYLYKITINMAE